MNFGDFERLIKAKLIFFKKPLTLVENCVIIYLVTWSMSERYTL